jgi:hypothetical protein
LALVTSSLIRGNQVTGMSKVGGLIGCVNSSHVARFPRISYNCRCFQFPKSWLRPTRPHDSLHRHGGPPRFSLHKWSPPYAPNWLHYSPFSLYTWVLGAWLVVRSVQQILTPLYYVYILCVGHRNFLLHISVLYFMDAIWLGLLLHDAGCPVTAVSSL